ncbi:MAG: TetR/AcrR family transcriptional regulator [Solirubrobacteraceae bacterium]
MILPRSSEPRDARRAELTQARRSIARRAAIDAAAVLFAKRGFTATTMADVSHASGLSLKALYGVFASKDELFSAVIDELFSHHLLPALQREASDEDPGEQVLTLVGDLLGAMEADRDYFMLYARGSVDVPESLKQAGRDPFEPYIATLASRLTSLITAAQGAGRARGVGAEAFATALVATVIALSREAVLGEPGRPITDLGDDIRGLFGPLLLKARGDKR